MDENVKRNLKAMDEWIVLTKMHMARVACETKAISLLAGAGMDLQGKDCILKLQSHLINANNCVSMIEQYADIKDA